MLSGSVPVAGVAGPAVISSVVSGGDVVTVANLAPLTIALMVKPSIEKPEDLRGKKIGVPRLGEEPSAVSDLPNSTKFIPLPCNPFQPHY
jgi:ABC-type nitrate/sulfonate/bicarbonate transport system substrate-binding protein